MIPKIYILQNVKSISHRAKMLDQRRYSRKNI